MLKAWLGGVWSCQVKQAFISALRGLALYGTVLSGLVRLCNARHFALGSCPVGSSGFWQGLAWRFLVEWGPVRLGQVRFGSARLGKEFHGIARSGCAGWSTLERGFVWLGRVSLWSCEVLFAAVEFCGVLYAMASFWRGIVWSREALSRVVKFGPVKHCYVRHARASLRLGIVRHGTVESGFARLRAAGQALVSLRLGWDWQGPDMHGIVKRASAMQGILRYGGYKK